MAVISPALVVAICVAFILTRVSTVRDTFEHLFFYGLRFCAEPSRNALAALVTRKHGAPTVGALPVARVPLTPAFFATEEEIPFLASFGHILAVLVGYIAGVLFEEVASCLWPSAMQDSHVWWLAVFIVLFSSAESVRVCANLESVTAPLISFAAATLAALAVVSRLDTAFDSFTVAAKRFLITRIQLPHDEAVLFSGRLALLAQLLTAATAGLLAAATLFPALHVAHLDTRMLIAQRRDPQSRKADPYSLPPRSAGAVILVLADYFVNIAALIGRAFGASSQLTLLTLGSAAFIKLVATRLRLQLHLDSAVDSFKAFWPERAALGVVPAGDRLRFKVTHKAWALTSVAFAAIANPVAILALALTAKRNGGISIGVCPVRSVTNVSEGHLVVREIAAFLAVFAASAYLFFAVIGTLYLGVSALLEGSGKTDTPNVRPLRASERRRQKRNLRAWNGAQVK